MEIKRKIRRQINEVRKNLDEDKVLRKSSIICKKLCELSLDSEFENILLYSSINNEVDLTEYFTYLKEKGKKIYYPKVSGETMEFYQICELKSLTMGCFSVMEPYADEKLKFGFDDKALMIVPGIAFSYDGYRIGYGKGYYDKYLSIHDNIMSVGVGFDFQLIDEKINDIYDERLVGIVTDKREVFRNE